jgi:hypothetical protein
MTFSSSSTPYKQKESQGWKCYFSLIIEGGEREKIKFLSFLKATGIADLSIPE